MATDVLYYECSENKHGLRPVLIVLFDVYVP